MQKPEEHNLADPFGEFRPGAITREFALLGARFEFRSHSAELMALVEAAYGGLPAQLLDTSPSTWPHTPPLLRVDLTLDDDEQLAACEIPPRPRIVGGAGLYGAVIDGHNFCFAAPAARGAQVSISRGLLARHAYHARYELLECAVFTLASRALGLVPLHAACVGLQGQGALLIGDSGTGKTTLTLQALLEGLTFLSEDGSFVDPVSLRVTGVPNYLHPRFDALRFVESESQRALIEAAPVIRRRSGVEKHELDLRRSGGVLAPAPLDLAAVVLLSTEHSAGGPLLRELEVDVAIQRLRASQPYAAQLDSWAAFEQHCARLPLLELRRGSHPREGVAELRRLLDGSSTR